jgi:hypothetical protein
MKRTKLAALLVAASTAVVGAQAAHAGLGIQIPGTNWSVASDDSGATQNGEDPVPQCSLNGYRLSLSNVSYPGGTATISSIVDKMTAGFTYVPGSATLTDVNSQVSVGMPDPALSGPDNSTLTWSRVNSDVPIGDTQILHFNVLVLNRADPNVKNPTALTYSNHGILVLSTGEKANQNAHIRVAKVLSDC